MRALVTGGAGFIGSHLADALLADGHDVIVLDNLVTGRVENVPDAAKFVEGDVADPEAVDRAVAGCDVVFHEAALGSVPRSIENPLATDAANVTGTLAVLDGAHRAGVGRVVLASSSSVYGGATTGPTSEDAPLVPRSPYAVRKFAGEHGALVVIGVIERAGGTLDGTALFLPPGGELVGKSGLKLAGTVDEGAMPLVLAGHRGAGGVYRSDGGFEKITAMEVQSAYVARDGYVGIASYAKSRDRG